MSGEWLGYLFIYFITPWAVNWMNKHMTHGLVHKWTAYMCEREWIKEPQWYRQLDVWMAIMACCSKRSAGGFGSGDYVPTLVTWRSHRRWHVQRTSGRVSGEPTVYGQTTNTWAMFTGGSGISGVTIMSKSPKPPHRQTTVVTILITKLDYAV